MEELDLKELFNIFWNKKIEIILVVLFFMLIGIVYTVGFTKPMYKSSTTLVLATTAKNDVAQSSSITSTTATEVTVNSKLVATYSEIVKSKNILRQVISNLNIDVEENSLRNHIKVSSVKDTELIEITVTDENAAHAAKIANEIALVFTEKVKEIYNIDNIQIVDKAEPANYPSNINHQRDIIVFGLAGLVLSSAYVLIANMLDTTIKTAEEVEAEFKLPVLASIPVYNIEAQKNKNKRKSKSKRKMR